MLERRKIDRGKVGIVHPELAEAHKKSVILTALSFLFHVLVEDDVRNQTGRGKTARIPTRWRVHLRKMQNKSDGVQTSDAFW